MLKELKSNSESYIVTCKQLWEAKIEPFEYLDYKPELQKKLEGIALNHKNQNRLSDFYQYLQEGQYWINLWTAYFLLEVFELKESDKLLGLNNEAGIIDFCFETVERNQPYLKKIIAKSNCEKWIKKKNDIQH
ncbi:MAG: hypothetical protein KI791_21250 [Cyclobacteriaceae bacterium]|nr:hypothetical protein [Cyclobacteriaceae bacterium SS2]